MISSFPIRHTYSWYASDDIVVKKAGRYRKNNDEKGATKARSQFALFSFILFICLFLFYFTGFFFFLHLPWTVAWFYKTERTIFF